MIPFLLVNIFAFDNSCSISLSFSLTFAFLLKLYSLLNKQGMWRPKHWEYSLRSALWCASLIINILWVQTLSAKANILFIVLICTERNTNLVWTITLFIISAQPVNHFRINNIVIRWRRFIYVTKSLPNLYSLHNSSKDSRTNFREFTVNEWAETLIFKELPRCV